MSDEREPNNRSDAALRERLEIAGKATKVGILGMGKRGDGNQKPCRS